jgi:hypothetical protein
MMVVISIVENVKRNYYKSLVQYCLLNYMLTFGMDMDLLNYL